MTKKILKINFDAGEIDSQIRYDLWRESFSTIFEFDSKTEIDKKSFNAKLETINFGSILLNTTETQQQFFNRSQKLIAQDSVDHCWLQIITQGSTKIKFSNKKCDVELRCGDIIFMDFCQPFNILTTDFRDINLIIPRQTIEQYFPNFIKYHGSVLPRESMFSKILNSHLLMLKTVQSNTKIEEATVLAEGVVQLAGLYLGKKLADEGGSCVAHNATKETIQCYILQNLNNSELTPSSIANNFRISRSYLYRMFPGEGIVNYIYEQRLKRAYRELNRINDNRRISEIAFSLGFESESHFSSSFRRFFSLSPSEVRYNAKEQKSLLELNLEQDESSTFQFNDWIRKL